MCRVARQDANLKKSRIFGINRANHPVFQLFWRAAGFHTVLKKEEEEGIRQLARSFPTVVRGHTNSHLFPIMHCSIETRNSEPGPSDCVCSHLRLSFCFLTQSRGPPPRANVLTSMRKRRPTIMRCMSNAEERRQERERERE